nr:hypothetical protein JVH1_3724 [Rhodococcus sp. JVH1]
MTRTVVFGWLRSNFSFFSDSIVSAVSESAGMPSQQLMLSWMCATSPDRTSVLPSGRRSCSPSEPGVCPGIDSTTTLPSPNASSGPEGKSRAHRGSYATHDIQSAAHH